MVEADRHNEVDVFQPAHSTAASAGVKATIEDPGIHMDG